MNPRKHNIGALAHAFVALVAATSFATPALAESVVFEDPSGDDHGPGTYVHPAADGFRPGTFDLRRLSLRRTGRGVTVTAAFGVAPQMVETRSGRDEPGRSVFMPVIDVYVTSSPSPGSGHGDVLPGRRIRVADGFGWDRAVVISSVPDLLSAHYSRSAPRLAADTCFAGGARVVGREIRVFVPDRCLPADLGKAWYLVTVTGLGPGAGMGRTLTADAPGSPDDADPFVREIGPHAGTCNVWEDGVGRTPCSFGGCEPCGWHPFVIDAIVPDGMEQESLLSSYSLAEKRLAVLPLFDASGNRLPVAAAVSGRTDEGGGTLRYPVVSTRRRTATIKMKNAPGPGTIGALVCPGERPGGTVVVSGVAAGFVVLEKVGDDAPPCKGAQVEF